MKRIGKKYNGVEPTGRLLKNLLSEMMIEIGQRAGESQIEILAAFSEIIGPEMEKMARASVFDRGVLTVKVVSSSLLDFLVSYEKQRILESMRKRFPNTAFKDIVFRFGLEPFDEK